MKLHIKVCSLLVALNMVLSRATPDLTEAKWKELDNKISKETSNLHHLLGHDQVPPDEAAVLLGEILKDFLEEEPEFQELQKTFFKQKESTTLEEARILKRDLKKKARGKNASREDKENHAKAVRIHAFLLKRTREKDEKGAIRKQEKAYRKNFFSFAKDACNGTLDTERVKPKFSNKEAFDFYQDRYANPGDIDFTKLDWFVSVPEPTQSYDRSAIRPGDVKRILKNKSPNTAPGEDGLLYGVLAKLPSIHHFLATLYSKINESCVAPESWATSLVVLAYKAGDEADPRNFRLIALTSSLGKPYHQIKADRMAEFMTANNYIDSSSQKAFLKG